MQLTLVTPSAKRELSPAEVRFYEHTATRYLKWRFRYDPIYATEVGVGGYDDQLPAYSTQGKKRLAAEHQGFLKELAAVDPDEFSEDGWLDYHALRGTLSWDLATRQMQNKHQDASEAVADLINLFEMYAPYAAGLSPSQIWPLIARIKRVPALLRSEHQRIKKPSTYFVDIAITAMEGLIVLAETLISEIILSTRSVAIRRELRNFRPHLMATFFGHLDWLLRIRECSHERYGAGKQAIVRILRDGCSSVSTPEAVVRLAHKQIRAIELEMRRLARRYGWSVSQLLQASRDAGDCFDGKVYLRAAKKMKQLVRQQNQVTLPTHESLFVHMLPAQLKGWASLEYWPPGRLSESQHGFLGFDDSGGERMSGPLPGTVSHYLLMAHELYPGHHLQYATANRHDSLLRRFVDSNIGAEAWAVYAESWVEPLARSALGRMQLLDRKLFYWHKAVIDIRLHQVKMSPAHARRMLISLGFDGEYADKEVCHTLLNPGYGMSYAFGSYRLQQLRAKAEDRGMSPKKFHDRYLSYGVLAPELIAQVF